MHHTEGIRTIAAMREELKTGPPRPVTRHEVLWYAAEHHVLVGLCPEMQAAVRKAKLDRKLTEIEAQAVGEFFNILVIVDAARELRIKLHREIDNMPEVPEKKST